MKYQNYFLTGILFIMSSIAFAQVQKAKTLQVGNTSTTTIQPSAALQLDDTTRGFLVARMTTAQRNAIASPATGLQVYDTDTNSLCLYNGTEWVNSILTGSKFSNDATNSVVRLNNLSDGTTARPVGKEFVVTDEGRIGIGYTTPSNTVHINTSTVPSSITGTYAKGMTITSNEVGTSYAGAGFYLENTGVNTGTRVAKIVNQGNYDTNSGTFMVIGASDDAEALEMGQLFAVDLASGNFAIGGQTATQKLDVDGNIKFSGALMPDESAGSAGNILVSYGENIAPKWSSDLHDDFTSHKIGIGTTAPSSKLTVNGGVNISGYEAISSQGTHLQWNREFGVGESWIINNKGMSTSPNAGIRFGSATSSNVVTEWARFIDNGNFGIGTDAPTAQLHTTGSVLFAGAGTPGAGKILTSDATGLATWQTLTIPTITGSAPIDVTSGTVSLNDAGITTSKLANNAVTVAKLPAGATATTFLQGDGNWTNQSATNTPSTAITASATQVAVASTNVQGALGDLATAVKTAANSTIYANDGTLSGNRTVNQGSNSLSFTSSAPTGTSHFTVDGTTLNVDAANNRIGIGTAVPTAQLHVVGNAIVSTMATGNATDDIVTVTAAGLLNRRTLTSVIGTVSNGLTSTSGVVTLGGSLIQPTTISGLTASNKMIFSGTGIDNFNVDAGTFSVDGTNNRVGIGNIAPTERLEVSGNIRADRLLAYGSGASSTNTAIGINSLNANTSGINNIAVGDRALSSNTTGQNNSGIGSVALTTNTTGSSNVANGYGTLQFNTTGSNNVAMGHLAFRNNLIGSSNIVLGYASGTQAADSSSITNMGTSILIGASTRPLANGQSNQIVIGDTAIGLGTNTVVLGNNFITTTALKGNVGIGTTTPTVKLEVAGAIKVGSETITTPTAGMIRFNSTSNTFEGFNGTAWITF